MKLRITAFAAMAAIGLAVTPAKAETFKWAFQGDVQTMDPHGLFETMTLGFQRNIYEGLVCLLYTSPSPRDRTRSRMPSSA